MPGFKPIRGSSGLSIPLKVAGSTTILQGNALKFSSGYATNETNGAMTVYFVAAEDCDNSAGSAGDKTVNAYLTMNVVIFECETNGTATQTDVGTWIDLTDANTLNESASSSKPFFVTEFVNSSTLRGFFIHQTP